MGGKHAALRHDATHGQTPTNACKVTAHSHCGHMKASKGRCMVAQDGKGILDSASAIQ